MDTVGELRKRFDHHLSRKPLRAAPEFCDAGLRLGADTLLFAAEAAPSGSQGGARLLALLRAGYGFPLPAAVVENVRRAARQWQRGERALAHIHLAFARLPRLADREAAFRLFLADAVLESGMTPEALIAALDAESVAKFDPDQPRVPAGSGRSSGQWTSDDGGGAPADEPVQTGRSVSVSRPASDRPFAIPIFLDDKAHNKENLDELVGAQRRLFGTETPEDDVAHGHPIPVAPSVSPLPFVFSPKPGAGGMQPPPIGPPDGPSDGNPKLCPKPGPDQPGGRGDFDLLFQQFIGTVVNPGAPLLDPRLGYGIPNPAGGKLVMFDQCRLSDGTVIEVKGHYDWIFENQGLQDSFQEQWTQQANRQIRAAQAAGRRLEWWFYESDVADFARKVFRDAGFGDDIKVFHHDYPGNDEWPYPPSATWAKGRQKQ